MLRVACLFLLLALPGLQAEIPSASVRLNVLFIAVDDLRPNLGCYGETGLKTPHMDRLASRGVRFQRAYCQIASCGPSRASLLTGRRPDATKVFDNRRRFREVMPEVVTLPQHFKNNGYYTLSLGKVFHGIFTSEINEDPVSWSEPAWRPNAVQYRTEEGMKVLRQRYPAQFDHTAGLVLEAQARRRFKGLAVESPDVEDNELTDGRTADKAVETLRQIKNKPFFLGVGFVKPHAPFVAPKKYFDLYQANDFQVPIVAELPRGTTALAGNDSKELRGYAGIAASGPILPEQGQWVTLGYNACVSYVDAQIGRLLDELERLGLMDRTVIVLWGDHGYHLGHNGLWCKNTNFEAAARVPLIVAAPGTEARGQSTDALVELVDLYPTLAELCSLPLAEGLHGTSFAPLLDQPGLPWKKAAFTQTPRPYTRPKEAMGRSLRTDRFRLVEWTGTRVSEPVYELYDYHSDTPENRNLAYQPDYEAVRKELTSALHAGWKAAVPPRHEGQ